MHEEEERQLCAQSCPYFLATYGRIQHPLKGEIPFALYPYQKQLVRTATAMLGAGGGTLVILKNRQVGCTTIVAGLALWLAKYRDSANIPLLSRREEPDARELLARAAFMEERLPVWLKTPLRGSPPGQTGTKVLLEFQNGSAIKSLSASPGSARSQAVTAMLLDEFAHVEADREILAAAKPATLHGGLLIIVSTPGGYGNEFARIYHEALQGGDPVLRALRIDGYADVPDYERVAERIGKGMTDQQRRQELRAEFLQGGTSVFEAADLDACFVPGRGRPPTPGERGAIGVDTAAGGEDRTSVTVLNSVCQELHHEAWRKPLPAGIERVREIARLHPGFALVIEQNAMGYAFLEGLAALAPVAFHTNLKTRPELLNGLVLAIERRNLVLSSEDTRTELRTLEYGVGGKIEAPGGYHDDCVFSLALALWGVAHARRGEHKLVIRGSA